MNVQEALEKEIEQDIQGSVMRFVARVAPIIERALRAAYEEGWTDAEETLGTGQMPVSDPDLGVTAGVAAMMEES